MIWLFNAWKRFGGVCKPHKTLLQFARCGHVEHVSNGCQKDNTIVQPLYNSTCFASESNCIPSTAFRYGNQFFTGNKLFIHTVHNSQIWIGKRSRYLNTGNQSSDMNKNWVARFPVSMQPYLLLSRMDRPIGYWLLYLPGAWSISLAAEASSLPNIQLLTLFFVGAVLMRSAGCVINDMWDSDLDRKVARTSTRPIASGDINHFQALVLLASQLSISLGILLSLNQYSIILGASSLVLVVSYPLMKRITFWPQLVLGLVLNWGCLLGWSAVTGSLDWSVCLPLYVAAVNWTVLYDTIYAFQDIDDDRWVGVKSTALLFGDNAKACLTGFAAVMIVNLVAVGISTLQTWPYYLGLMAVTTHLTWQVATVNLSEPKDCLSKFKSNKWLGILLWISIVAGTLCKSDQTNTESLDTETTSIKAEDKNILGKD